MTTRVCGLPKSVNLFNTEPYRVCRRLNILRDYSDEKPNYTPEIRERAVQLLIESEKIIHRIGQQFPQLLLKLAVLLKHFVFGIKNT